MEYRDTIFKPKPKCVKSEQCLDAPCKLDRFTCSRKWWEREIKTFIDRLKEEFNADTVIDVDNCDDHEVTIRLNNRYIYTATSKEEISTVLKTAYNMLLIGKYNVGDDLMSKSCCSWAYMND